jgi:hypothetical protein
VHHGYNKGIQQSSGAPSALLAGCPFWGRPPGAALAFYLALGVIVVKFVMAMVTTIAAYASAVFSWAGLC